MTQSTAFVFILPITLFSVGCASVPDVEHRLQNLQFHPNMYVVQAGDTLDTIAFRYQIESGKLIELNPRLQHGVNAGTRINIRPGTQLSDAVRARATYSSLATSQVRSNSRINSARVTSLGSRPVTISPVPSSTAVRGRQTGATGDAYPREEIIPDNLEYQPVPSGRVTLDADLQQYVGSWIWPTDGQIAREFAPDEVGGQGVDIAGVPGQEIRAASGGTVVYSGRDLSGGGNLIIVRHADNLMTTYSHADNLYVAEDDHVQAGDAIASLGANARSESVLRFEVRRDGNPLDPTDFLPLE